MTVIAAMTTAAAAAAAEAVAKAAAVLVAAVAAAVVAVANNRTARRKEEVRGGIFNSYVNLVHNQSIFYLTQKNHLEQFRLSHPDTLVVSYPLVYITSVTSVLSPL